MERKAKLFKKGRNQAVLLLLDGAGANYRGLDFRGLSHNARWRYAYRAYNSSSPYRQNPHITYPSY
jgi:hypothetical protein